MGANCALGRSAFPSLAPMTPLRTQTVYKIASADAWTRAERDGVFAGAPVDQADGFIHFSTATQLRATAAKHFRAVPNLVLVVIRGEALNAMGDAYRFEPSRGGDLFPHLYAPLPLDAVAWVEPLPWDERAGEHRFPRGL